MSLVSETNKGITFINYYTAENPMLNSGDECYFLASNILSYFAPVVFRGRIIQDKFNQTINKQYYIQILEYVDNIKLIEDYVFNKQFNVYEYDRELESISYKSKLMYFPDYFSEDFLKDNLMLVEAFFVRKTMEDILQLRREFLDVIKEDLLNTFKEVEFIKSL